MQTLQSIHRRRLLGAVAASIAMPALSVRHAFAKEETRSMSTTSNYLPVRAEWLASGKEAALEPEMPIIDAHHHFYERPGWTYLLDEYLEDARSGHNITASVFMQALTRYRTTGPEPMRPIGEVEYVAQVTAPMQEEKPQVGYMLGLVQPSTCERKLPKVMPPGLKRHQRGQLRTPGRCSAIPRRLIVDQHARSLHK